MDKELWKPVVGYEGLYDVSAFGKVKSLKFGKEKELKQTNNTDGYLYVSLYKDGVRKLFKVHRLVAEAFIPNPDNKPCIDHINTIRDDNRAENLRWCTQKENCNNELTRKNQSNGHKGLFSGENNPMYGKHHSEEHRRKISEGGRGLKRTEETRKKIAEAKRQYWLKKKNTPDTM